MKATGRQHFIQSLVEGGITVYHSKVCEVINEPCVVESKFWPSGSSSIQRSDISYKFWSEAHNSKESEIT